MTATQVVAHGFDREHVAARLFEEMGVIVARPVDVRRSRVQVQFHLARPRTTPHSMRTVCGLDASDWEWVHPTLGVNAETGLINVVPDRICSSCIPDDTVADDLGRSLESWLRRVNR